MLQLWDFRKAGKKRKEWSNVMQQIQTHQLDSDVGPGVLQSGAAQTLMKRNSDVPEALAVITWRL